MHVLILGGTSFVVRHVVETALAAGHCVTQFNRGDRRRGFRRRTTLVRGDRDVSGDVARFADVGADAVVNVRGYAPDAARASVFAVSDSAARCAFVSTIDVRQAAPHSAATPSDARRCRALVATEALADHVHGDARATERRRRRL